jgi:pantetheine-phosphate adenylyltransferase
MSEKRIAVFPGSFDPITKGHEDIILRGARLFDELIVAVGENDNKNYLFDKQQRLAWIRETFKNEARVRVESYTGLTVDFCIEVGAGYMIRGLRNPADLEFEKAVAQANQKMRPDIETVFLLTQPELSCISSSIVRDVLRNGGDHRLFVPEAVRIQEPFSK